MAIKINNIKATNLELTDAIRKYATEKIGMLEKFVDPEDTSVSVDIEVEKTTDHHQKGRIFRAEFNLMKKGKLFRAEETTEDLYAAIDMAKDELARELRRTQNKERTLRERGNRAIKYLMRGFRRSGK